MKTVLVVEDEKMIRQGIAAMIKRSGVPVDTVLECKNGLEAMGILKEKKVDVMFTDIRMPKMNGIDALTEVIKFDPKANVIMCSDQKYENMIVMAIKRGAKDFIIKPFTSSDVITAVNKVFDDDDE